jgi:hypothetical protein
LKLDDAGSQKPFGLAREAACPTGNINASSRQAFAAFKLRKPGKIGVPSKLTWQRNGDSVTINGYASFTGAALSMN